MTLTYTFRDGTTTTDTQEWALRYEDHEYRRGGADEFTITHESPASDTTWRVSTIWQGLPAMPDEKPRVYETAIFRNGNLVGEIHHVTEAEAVGAHADLVDALKATNRIDSLREFGI